MGIKSKLDAIKNSRTVHKTNTIIGKGITAALILHGLTFTAYLSNEVYHKARPSQIRQEFNREYGIPLKGWHHDIEENKRDISFLAATVAREQMEKPFDLRSIRIEPENYLKNNPLDQFGRWFTTGHTGYYIPKVRAITATRAAGRDTWHHEIKHAKTFDVLEHHPEFKARWEALTKDHDGNSLYLGIVQEGCIRIRGLSWAINHSKHDYRLSERFGFVSDYARTNFYEDVAEVGVKAEMEHNSDLARWMFGPERNERIAGKLELMEEYGLIPKGFKERLHLEQEVYRTVWGSRNSMNHENIPGYMEASQKFLTKHPNTVYEADIRASRAIIMLSQVNNQSSKYTWKDAEVEYTRTLNAPLKSTYGYHTALEKMQSVAKLQNDLPRAKVFEEAQRLLMQRIGAGDIHLAKRGVNDFLKEKGVLK